MSAPKIPKSEKYWKNKGKKEIDGTYKNVMLYTHDDLDGIYSAIAMRNHLIEKGYTIIGYGVVNYQDGWELTELNDELINIAVDFASDHPLIDIYVDHHGDKLSLNKTKHSVKTPTCSAFEGILLQYGIPICDHTLAPIDMVDSAKYSEYNVDVATTLYFDWDIIMNSYNPKLTFTGSINQRLKRSDHATIIETIHNTKEPSIYAIYRNLKRFYKGNNIYPDGERKEFIKDGNWRIDTMCKKTRGVHDKPVFYSQKEFIKHHYNKEESRIDLSGKGYQVFGNLAFIPSGTWANGIRARAILQEDMEDGILEPDSIKYILLQYGNTLQLVTYDKMENIPIEERPLLKNGTRVTNLGKYMAMLLDNFKKHMGYIDPNTELGGDDDITVAGGHGGIGTISNICNDFIIGDVLDEQFIGIKYLDVFKNKIIQDIANIEWNNLKISWSTKAKNYYTKKPMNMRVMMLEEIRTDPDQLTPKEKEIFPDIESRKEIK